MNRAIVVYSRFASEQARKYYTFVSSTQEYEIINRVVDENPNWSVYVIIDSNNGDAIRTEQRM